MPGAGSTERNDGSRRRRGSADGRAPQAPRFINRLPMRLPAPLHERLHPTARGRGFRDSSPGAGAKAPPSRVQDATRATRTGAARTMLEAQEMRRTLAKQLPQSDSKAAVLLSKPNEKGPRMRNPCIRSLDTVTLEEALSYLDAADGDELGAAFTLARDRNSMDGSVSVPDETEVHPALFLLRRARGLNAPSFDLMRVQLRRRAA